MNVRLPVRKIAGIFAICILVSCTKNVMPTFSILVSSITSWRFVDGVQNDGIISPPYLQNFAQSPSLASVNNQLYVAHTGSAVGGLSSAVFNGNNFAPAWSYFPNFSSQTSGPGQTLTPFITAFNSELYAIWIETKIGNLAGTQQVQVAALKGNSWTSVDTNVDCGAGDLTPCINISPSKNAATPILIPFNNTLHAFWTEVNGSSNFQLVEAAYSGNDTAPSWTSNPSLNITMGDSAYTPQAIVYLSNLLVIWAESNGANTYLHLDVSSDGVAFANIDGNLPAIGGILASMPYLAVFNNKLYATWVDTSSGTGEIRLAVFNGNFAAPNWNVLDSGGGINKNTSMNANSPKIAIFFNQLYGTWVESNGTANQTRVVVYNGNDNAPNGYYADGDGVNGLNLNPAFNASYPSLTVFNGNIYSSWEENGSGLDVTRIAIGL